MSLPTEQIEAQRRVFKSIFHKRERHLIGPLELERLFEGYRRYEFVRKLDVSQFAALFMRNLETGQSFDSLVDEAMTGANPEPRLAHIEKITTPLASTEDMDNDRLYQKWSDQEPNDRGDGK
jgi:hypothetical protein